MNQLPSKRIHDRGARLGFAMVFATLVANGILTYLNVRQLHAINTQEEQSRLVLLELKTLLNTVTDAETGMRGYLITRQPEYLRPYEVAVTQVQDSLERLVGLTESDDEQRGRAASLERQTRQIMDHTREYIAMVDQEDFESIQARMLAGQGRTLMEEARDTVEMMEERESARLQRHGRDSRFSYVIAVTTACISTVLGLVLAVAGARLVRREIVLRERAAENLREANLLLEERVRERTAEVGRRNESLRLEIEERTHAEAEVRRVAEELRRSNLELEQFASIASHDLQEPLRKVQAFGARLEQQCGEALDAKGRDYLKRLLGSVGRMRRLIDDLLAFSRVSSKPSMFERVDLNALVREVLRDLEERIRETEGEVRVEPLPQISADPVQLRQLFQNLIGNGLKFRRADTPPRVVVSGRLYSTALAWEEAAGDSSMCEIVVEDNGIGFEPDDAERIFGLFQRLHGRNRYEGTGLGLSICRRVVERHGGAIRAEGAPRQGARFIVSLPVNQPAEVNADYAGKDDDRE